MDKYDRLAEKARVAAEANERLKAQLNDAYAAWEAEKATNNLPRPHARDMPLWPEVQQAGAAMLDFVMAEFRGQPNPDADRPRVKQVFESHAGLTGAGIILTDAASLRASGDNDAVIAIWAAKWMLSEVKLPLDTQAVSSFNDFADHFKGIILS